MSLPPEAVYDAAFQGSRGAFSEDAAFRLLSREARLLPCDRFEDVFEAVRRGEARFGVVPIENTLAGSIHRCYDLLNEHDLKIVGETICHIEHALIARPGAELSQIRRAMSHPVALAQCEKFFRQHPEIEPVSVYDTAGAVENMMHDGRNDCAAVAGRRAAEVYGGVILAAGIQDHSENYTRFLLITPGKDVVPEGSSEFKTTVVFRIANVPGGLYNALRPFAERRIDLSKLESRPIPGAPFEYLFYLDLIGCDDQARISGALDELRKTSAFMRVLGSYKRFKGSRNGP
jgi:prephenate dehydratase